MGIIGDALAAGGGQYLKWEVPGTTYTGTITDAIMRQAKKYESSELDTWDDGSPKMQIVITLATAYRDPANPDDDGTRQLSVNVWGGQKSALVAAIKQAGVSEPEAGMGLTVTHVEGIGNAKSPRVFKYELTPAPSDVWLALDTATLTPEPQPPTANPVDLAKQLLAAGLSVADAAAASGMPATTVQALANITT
jgi:hypothetical protein